MSAKFASFQASRDYHSFCNMYSIIFNMHSLLGAVTILKYMIRDLQQSWEEQGYIIVIIVSVRGLPGDADPGGVPGLAAAALAAGAVRGHADRPHPLHLRIHLRCLPHRYTQVRSYHLLQYLLDGQHLLAKIDFSAGNYHSLALASLLDL